MELVSHLAAPVGEATRREIQHLLELHRIDNMYWISGMLNSGRKVPCCCKRAEILYLPPMGAETQTPEQHFYSAPFLFSKRLHKPSGRMLRYGSCCDIAAYDAAAMEVLYKVPTKVMVPRSGNPERVGSYHANIIHPGGHHDPVANWRTVPCRCPQSPGSQ